MKKLLFVFIALLGMVAFIACNNDKADQDEDDGTEQVEEADVDVNADAVEVNAEEAVDEEATDVEEEMKEEPVEEGVPVEEATENSPVEEAPME